MSGSWDKTVKLWDPRSDSALAATVAQPERVYAMDLAGDKCVPGARLCVRVCVCACMRAFVRVCVCVCSMINALAGKPHADTRL